MGARDEDDWQRLLAAERRLQQVVPEAVLVGGTAAALHAGHRISLDGDHVLGNLRDRFEEVLARLESTPGWKTERIQKPVLILGALDGCLSGLRQLRRTQPVEVQVLEGLRVPTLAEMVRIKAWLFLTRDSTRDLLDVTALLDKLGQGRLAETFTPFDEIYGRGPRGGSPLVELADRLAAARPADRASVDLRTYKGVQPPWHEWKHIEDRSRFWAARIAGMAMES
jgi:hypothetical protein